MAQAMAVSARGRGYRGPVVGSLALHAAIVALLSLNLSFCERELKLPPVPAHVRAVVIEAPAVEPVAAAPVVAPAPPAELPKPEPKKPAPKKAEPRPAPKPVAKPAPVKKAGPAPKPVAKPEPKKAEARPAPRPALPTSDLDALMASEDRDLAARDAAQRAASDKAAREQAARNAQEQKVLAEYQRLIFNEVSRRWSRPPSARKGMETTLRITLIPGGEVLDVQVAKSSGDAAFDRSTENAVRLAGRLPVPNDPDLFNRDFRRLTMVFRPEDLEK